MSFKKLIAIGLAVGLLGLAAIALVLVSIEKSLPQIMKIEDYKPLLVSEVYARGGEKFEEFAHEKRTLVAYDKIPRKLIDAFLAAEDDQFFKHRGINYFAILRATLANLRAGHTVQGGSTITQQVAKSLFLSPDRNIIRKIREAMLAYKLEEHLSKEDILYLYVNQIYLGAGAYGVAAAADSYFRKTVDQLTLAEMAMLAGLPPAPGLYSPSNETALNKQRDKKEMVLPKQRQRFVLNRMASLGMITPEEAQKAINEPIKVWISRDFKNVGACYGEAVRQLLVKELGEEQVLENGLRIYTGMDYKAQQEAQKDVREGLREVDKRQGYRGPIAHYESQTEIDQLLIKSRRLLRVEKNPTMILPGDGMLPPEPELKATHTTDKQGNIVSNLPEYISKGKVFEAVVTKVDDTLGLVYVVFADGQGLLDISEMGWARKPDPSTPFDKAAPIKKPSTAVKAGDVILVKATGDKFFSNRLNKLMAEIKKTSASVSPPFVDQYAHLTLDQDPVVQGAFVSVDNKTQELIAMVGGYECDRGFNRAIQAKRQTGSSFKSIVYASALDKGFTGATQVVDAPIVYKEKDATADEGQDTETKVWKPHNYTNKFNGDILFRTALARSLNIPTVKILEEIGVDWAIEYCRRLGIFSPLNKDLSLGLGSSGVTLYEMTRVFSEFARLGRRVKPIIITKVEDRFGKVLVDATSLDKRFADELEAFEKKYDDKQKELYGDGAKSEPPQNPANSPGSVAGSNGDGVAAVGGAVAPTNTPEVPPETKKKTPNIYFADPEQMISSQTAYLITNLLTATINDEGGTAARAKALGRPAAGKTGTTNGYYDTWFIGFTPQITSGVWVGFDQEKTMGAGEAGGRTALPIWLEYMKLMHENVAPTNFSVPSGIVFANIDARTGKLASSSSSDVFHQAFLLGTEPKEMSGSETHKDESDFYKEDLTE